MTTLRPSHSTTTPFITGPSLLGVMGIGVARSPGDTLSPKPGDAAAATRSEGPLVLISDDAPVLDPCATAAEAAEAADWAVEKEWQCNRIRELIPFGGLF